MESGGKRVEYEALEERICKRRRRRRRTKYFRVFLETVKWGLPYYTSTNSVCAVRVKYFPYATFCSHRVPVQWVPVRVQWRAQNHARLVLSIVRFNQRIKTVSVTINNLE